MRQEDDRIKLLVKVIDEEPPENVAAEIDVCVPFVPLMKISRKKHSIEVTVPKDDKQIMMSLIRGMEHVSSVTAQ